jgi:hypothetical protein
MYFILKHTILSGKAETDVYEISKKKRLMLQKLSSLLSFRPFLDMDNM